MVGWCKIQESKCPRGGPNLPEARPTERVKTVDTNSVPQHHEHGEQERPCACYEGVVFIGELVEVDGVEVEVVEGVPCRRCSE